MSVNIDFFFKQFTKLHQTIDCKNGLQLIWKGDYKGKNLNSNLRYDSNLRDFENVPIYFINNPQDSPYTVESIEYFIEELLTSFRSIIPIDKSYNTARLYYIESEESLYIPNRVLRNITNKLQNLTIDISVDPVRLIGEFDGQFEISESAGDIHINFDFILSELHLNGEEIDSSHDDYDDWIDYFRYDNRDILENEVWPCISELSTNKNFVNFDWMGWYTGFYFIT
jgi:hypothetical protein